MDEQSRTFELESHLGWTMARLANAGDEGVTPIDRPAQRWSGYVHQLRHRGISIGTEIEADEDTYAGTYARYRLACDVTFNHSRSGDGTMNRLRVAHLSGRRCSMTETQTHLVSQLFFGSA